MEIYKIPTALWMDFPVFEYFGNFNFSSFVKIQRTHLPLLIDKYTNKQKITFLFPRRALNHCVSSENLIVTDSLADPQITFSFCERKFNLKSTLIKCQLAIIYKEFGECTGKCLSELFGRRKKRKTKTTKLFHKTNTEG